MNYLIDTHTLLWLIDDESAIPDLTLQQLRNPANALFVSIASIWEIAIKRSLGKLAISQPTQVIVDELPTLGISLLPILASHAIQVEQLPFHHRDPFDRIIIAQALSEDCVIVSKDGNFPLYAVPVLWK
ncbi:type II toxin-antitoxin system VapC family toxin [Fibrella sp. WM1]|uniref:type II toxin-antitoxin system VapC family toxin n=1 Tax=Fibrella musci TaxID=3242485 RepID=UPI00351F83D8